MAGDVRLVAVAALLLAACEERETEQFQVTKLCSGEVAKIAVSKVITPIMLRIADPRTRMAGCSQLDDVIRSYNQAFDAYKPTGCEWGVGRDEPEQILRSFGNAHSSRLAALCEWQNVDARRRGRQILDSMSPEDRRTIENAYNGF